MVAVGTGDEKRVARPTGDTFFIVRTGRGLGQATKALLLRGVLTFRSRVC